MSDDTLARWLAEDEALCARIPRFAPVPLEAKVNLVRAITPDVKLVRAKGRVVHGGRQVATAEGRLVGPDGKLHAHGTTTCLVFEVPT